MNRPRPSIVNVRTPSVTRVARSSSFARASIKRAPPLIDPAALAATARHAGRAALASGEKAGKAGFLSGLRFMQFMRAYMKGVAAGLGSFLLLTELANGHFNVFAMVGMHLFAIVAAPFYALMLSPTLFAIYRGLAVTGLTPALRGYAVACMLGLLLLFQRIATGKFLIAGNYKEDILAVGMTLCGVVAGYTFNRAASKISTAEAGSTA